MLHYLSDAWLAAAAEHLSGLVLDPAVAAPGLVVVTRIDEVPGATGEPHRTVEYGLVFADNSVYLTRSPAPAPGRPEVRFTQDFRIAEGVARGNLSAQSAFMSGDIKLGGDASALIAHAGLIGRIGDALKPLRAATAFSRPEPI